MERMKPTIIETTVTGPERWEENGEGGWTYPQLEAKVRGWSSPMVRVPLTDTSPETIQLGLDLLTRHLGGDPK